MKKILLSLIACCVFLSGFCQTTSNIRLNQIGFYTNGPKLAAVVTDTATKFFLKSVDGTVYYTGKLGSPSTWAQSGEKVKMADFSSHALEGMYILEVPGLGSSYPFHIQNQVLVPLNKALIKAYYFNRSSTALDAAYAGKWARKAGHLDTHMVVHPSAASTARPTGTIVSCPKGWYDAGDYNSYIVNSGISTYTLLASYEHFKSYYDTLHLNIPESGNNLPDILDEIKWNLDWMLCMQDPNDGGVYFKKTTAAFCGFIMPEKDTATRYVVTKSTTSALDFAAVMAVAYRIYKEFDGTYAATCLSAAQKAYDWGVKNNAISFSNPKAQGNYPAISTGGYGDSNFADELEWASNELYIATKTDTYYAKGFKRTTKYDVPTWGTVNTLGLLSLLHNRKNLTAVAFKDTTSMKDSLLSLVQPYINYQKNTSPYKIMMGYKGNNDFTWGSNSFAANQAMLALNAYFMTGNKDYANATVSQVDYLVGRNATGYSFVTGMGSKPPMHIHHRQSEADGVVDPVPGWLSGGPTASTGDKCPNNTMYTAKSYTDSTPCYTKNEIAINWNAPAVYITGALEFLRLFNKDIGQPSALDASSYEGLPSSFVVFPVPSKQEVFANVQVKTGGTGLLKITDALGREQMRQEVVLGAGMNQLSLDVHALLPGVYLLSFDMADTHFKGKIVLENN